MGGYGWTGRVRESGNVDTPRPLVSSYCRTRLSSDSRSFGRPPKRQGVSGIALLSGWAFSMVPGAPLTIKPRVNGATELAATGRVYRDVHLADLIAAGIMKPSPALHAL